MRHRVAGRKLGRTSEHRLSLLRNLSTALFDKEKITTTLAKAKELRPFAEKLVTLSKKETLQARRRVMRHIHDRGVVAKLFDTLSARYAQRPGGYTRIVKLGPRRGDHAEMAVIELVGAEPAAAVEETKGKDEAEAVAGEEPKPRARKRTAVKAAGKKTASKAKKKKAGKKTAKKAKARKAAGDDERPARRKKKKAGKKTAKRTAKKTAGKSTKKTAKKAGKKTARKAKSSSRKRSG